MANSVTQVNIENRPKISELICFKHSICTMNRILVWPKSKWNISVNLSFNKHLYYKALQWRKVKNICTIVISVLALYIDKKRANREENLIIDHFPFWTGASSNPFCLHNDSISCINNQLQKKLNFMFFDHE